MLEKDIDSKYFDFHGFNSEIENFGHKQCMNQKSINAIESIFEELCVDTIIPSISKFHFSLEYSEQENKSDITVSYNGESLNLLTNMNPISKKIIEHVSSGLTWEYKNGENRIHLLVN